MTLLYSESCFLQHETGHHPENADRVRLAARMLVDFDCLREVSDPASAIGGRPTFRYLVNPKVFE